MLDCFSINEEAGAVDITALNTDALAAWLKRRDERTASWIAATGFAAKPGETCLIPSLEGSLDGVLVGVDDPESMWDFAALPGALPAGHYRLSGCAAPELAALAWALGCYRFTRYKQAKEIASGAIEAVLCLDGDVDPAAIDGTAAASYLTRDLINMPAADMGPEQLAAAAADLASTFGGRFSEIAGDDLLAQNYPAVHAVGRASERAPRLIDLVWGDEGGAKVTLVGKGVCFDTGGLDLKPADGMKLMKKDMGGAAHALGLARMIMAQALPVRLRVLIPAVENSVAGNAMYPLDVVPTRQGTTVEIGNTDAEGRVILADALCEAGSENPDLLIDFATLTGAARVALGTDLPALFCNDDGLARDIEAAGVKVADPVWRLPLWPGYRKQIESKVADITNAPEGRFGGAITAALFLEEFVAGDVAWAHIDLMAWNRSDRPGRPEGGEAMAMRALYEVIAGRFPK